MNTKGTKSLLRIASVVFVIGTSILGGSGCSKEDANQYVIIDLSAGANAQAYPVTWLKTIPEGGWTDEYKTTKLVLRRIAPGTFKMGSSEDEQGRGKKNTTEKRHSVTLTRPFYMGVFEVTQKQWELVMGTRPSAFCREKYYTMRPVEQVSYDMIRGENNGSQWPLSAAVDTDSFIGRLRSRTNLAGLDLPTEAQWEYACRGSATNTALNCGLNLKRIVKDGEATDDYKLNSIITNVSDIARCWAKDVKKPKKKGHGRTFVFERAGCYGDLGVYDTSKGTAIVGSFPPNSFGLYDMHGNVGEWCLDAGSPYTEDAVQDPLGDEPSTIDVSRMARGGGWSDDIGNCRSANRLWLDPSRDHDSQGLRVCYMADPYKGSAPVAVNKVPPKKITKLKGISIGELIPSVLKDCMKYKEYDFTTPKSCQYIANEEDLDGEAKSFFLKSDWLTGVEIDIVPGTKEVFDIQVSYGAEDEEEADAKADALATIVQEDLGIVFKKMGMSVGHFRPPEL